MNNTFPADQGCLVMSVETGLAQPTVRAPYPLRHLLLPASSELVLDALLLLKDRPNVGVDFAAVAPAPSQRKECVSNNTKWPRYDRCTAALRVCD